MTKSADPIHSLDVSLGRALRRWRVLHRVKQADAAQRLGVAQSTISRWEAGVLAMDRRQRAQLDALVATRLDGAADRVLGGLVADSPRAVHLICDRTHRLLASSKLRATEFGVDLNVLLGSPLRPFASEAILREERRLLDRGWYDLAAPDPIEFETGDNRSRIVRIRKSRCRWTRLLLSDGAAVRLVETL